VKQTAIVYAELQLAYDTFNERLFDNSLSDCLLTLQRVPRAIGYFSAARFGNKKGDHLHEIALNPDCFARVPLVEIMATIAHEMAHLWQHEHATPGRGRYHDKEWGDKMESIGLMPSATGRPGGKKTGDKMADYPIEGGRFLEVCRELLTKDFKISWYDRFSVRQGLADSGASAPGIVLDLPPAAVAIPAASGLQMAAPSGSAANKSNRSKYACDCPAKLQVWGKPGLKVKCGECDKPLEEEA
jgi:predicted SprT family Zn-dependent metalloprotease